MAVRQAVTMETIKERNKNMAKVSNDLLETFIRKNNAVCLKILMFIAKSALPAEEIAKLPDDKIINISLDIKSFLNYSGMNIKTLKRNIKLLTETSINYKNDNGEGFITVLPKAFFDNNGKLELLIFSEILKLTHALKRFSVIDVSQVMMLDSKHSIRMLMLLERIYNFADNVSKRQKYELEDLNLLFGTQYKKIAEIERAILIPAKKELDSTSKISFEYQINYDKIHHTKGRSKAVSVTIDLIQRKFLQGTF
jgi:hypothetical protein